MNNKYEIYVNEPLGVVVAKMSRQDFIDEVFTMATKKLLRRYKNTKIGVGEDWCSSLSDYVYSYFIHPTVDTWGRFRLLVIMDAAAVDTAFKYLFETLLPNL